MYIKSAQTTLKIPNLLQDLLMTYTTGNLYKRWKWKTLSNIPLYITGSSFSGDAFSQLSKFVDVAKKSATFNKIYVENASLQSQLSSLGLPVETKTITTTD